MGLGSGQMMTETQIQTYAYPLFTAHSLVWSMHQSGGNDLLIWVEILGGHEEVLARSSFVTVFGRRSFNCRRNLK